MHQDAGAKVTHLAPHTTSQILSKSVSKVLDEPHIAVWYASIRVHVTPSLTFAVMPSCSTRMLAPIPTQLSVSKKIRLRSATKLLSPRLERINSFYLMSRGLDESEAYSLIVNGFIEPITKELPMEYAVELNRLIQLEMSGSVG